MSTFQDLTAFPMLAADHGPLKQNLLVMFVCIINRIPLFIVGAPGVYAPAYLPPSLCSFLLDTYIPRLCHVVVASYQCCMSLCMTCGLR